MPRAKQPNKDITDEAAIRECPVASSEDWMLLATFATGLLRDGTGAYDADDIALRNRVKDAFNRARVMLEEFKKFNI